MSRLLKATYLSGLLLSAFSSINAGWSPSQSISCQSAEVSVAMDGSGNAMAVWNSSLGTTANEVNYNYIVKGNHWYAGLSLSNTGGRGIMSIPQIAIDKNSNVLVVWDELDFASGSNVTSIKSSTLPFPGKWSTPVDITKSPGVGRFQRLAMNSSGFAVLVWRDNDQQGDLKSKIFSSTLQIGGEWSEPHQLGIGENPKVAVDESGNAVAIWEDTDSVLQYATSKSGEGWSNGTVLSTENASSDYVIAMNPAGEAIAVWKEWFSSGMSLKSSTMTFGDLWTPPKNILVSGSLDISSNGIDVAIDAEGNATVVWGRVILDQRMAFPMPIDTFVQSAYLPVGKNWTQPVRISPKRVVANSAKVALDSLGNATAVWSTDHAIQVATRPSGNSKWTKGLDISAEGKNSQPVLAVDPTGYAVVCWINSAGVVQSSVWTP